MTNPITKQRGYLGHGIAKAMASLFITTALVSAVGGWALIEGIIWLFSHITLGWKP